MRASKGNWVHVCLTPEETLTLKKILEVCLDAGGHEMIFRPLLRKVEEATLRISAAKLKKEGEHLEPAPLRVLKGKRR